MEGLLQQPFRSGGRKVLSPRRLIGTSSKTLYFLSVLFSAQFRKISYRRELAEQFREQSQAVDANSFVFRHHHDAVEKLIDNLAKARNGLQRLLILPRALVGLHLCGGSANSGIKFAFGTALEQLRVDVPPVAGSDVCFLQDLANALEGYRQWFEVLGLANSL